jgi:hypothetical protein
MGCLSQCGFSSWADNEKNTTGRLADPRSFCIQKTLQEIAHGGSTEQNLMFAGHSAFRFKKDPFYSNGFVPTVEQLVERIRTGDCVNAEARCIAVRRRPAVGDSGAVAAAAGDALHGVHFFGARDDAHRSWRELSRHLALHAAGSADPGGARLS